MKNLKKNFMAPFYGWGSTASRLQSHYEKAAYFLPLSFRKFLLTIWMTSERWKAESTLEPPSGFEHRTPWLGIQLLNHICWCFTFYFGFGFTSRISVAQIIRVNLSYIVLLWRCNLKPFTKHFDTFLTLCYCCPSSEMKQK